jgi:hypothetical protein
MGVNFNNRKSAGRHRVWAFVITVLLVFSVFATGSPQPVYAGTSFEDGSSGYIVHADPENLYMYTGDPLAAPTKSALICSPTHSAYYSLLRYGVFRKGTDIAVSLSPDFLSDHSLPPDTYFSLSNDIDALTNGAVIISENILVDTVRSSIKAGGTSFGHIRKAPILRRSTNPSMRSIRHLRC